MDLAAAYTYEARGKAWSSVCYSCVIVFSRDEATLRGSVPVRRPAIPSVRGYVRPFFRHTKERLILFIRPFIRTGRSQHGPLG